MGKYMLARGQTRLPIDGIRTTPRANDKPLRTAETVIFSQGKVVESDLDFGPWVTEGVLIRLDVRPTLRPDPKPPAAPAMILPTPIPARVEVVREAAPIARAPQVAESHLTTAPKPQPVADPVPAQAQVKADLADAGVPTAPAPAPIPDPISAPAEEPVAEQEQVASEPEEPEAPAETAATAPAKAPARPAKGRNRRGR